MVQFILQFLLLPKDNQNFYKIKFSGKAKTSSKPESYERSSAAVSSWLTSLLTSLLGCRRKPSVQDLSIILDMQTKTLQMQNVHHPSLSFAHLVLLSPGLCKAVLLIKVDGRHLIWSNTKQKLKRKTSMKNNSYICLPNPSVPSCHIIKTNLFNLVLPGPATCCPVYRK